MSGRVLFRRALFRRVLFLAASGLSPEYRAGAAVREART